MNTKKLGCSDVFVSDQIFGCWAIGGSYFTGAVDSKSIEAMQAAIDLGITTLDTAPVYGDGHSESLVREAIKSYKREDLSISTKLPSHLLAKNDVRPACEKSLKTLNQDYVDIYFIHWPSRKGDPIGETMEELMKLKDEGKIRCIGLSNFSKEQIIEAQKYGDIAVIQPCYSLLWRFSDMDEFAYCRDNNIGIIPYSPLAQGILTGKFTKDTVFPADDGRNHAPIFSQPTFGKAIDTVEQLRPFAEKYGVTLAQLSIGFLMQTPGITAPIVGAKNVDQVRDNQKAGCFTLSKEDYDAIDVISKNFAYNMPKFKNFFEA